MCRLMRLQSLLVPLAELLGLVFPVYLLVLRPEPISVAGLASLFIISSNLMLVGVF